MTPDVPLHFHSATELARAIRNGELSSRALAELFLDRMERSTELRAFVHVTAERALALADAADRLLAAGIVHGPLHGVPVAIKDSIGWEGTPLGGGSLTRAGHISDRSSTVVKKLIAAGMIVLGKTSMTELAFGLSGQNPTCGTARNPWDPSRERAPGGSSSGAGVAVAAGLAPAALGGDTGGSVRAPALLNHLVGYKPSSGLISRAGCLPLSETLDVIGPIARTVEDVRVLADVLRGPDFEDPVTLTPRVRLAARPMRTLAVLAEPDWPLELVTEARDHWRAALDRIASSGWTLEEWRVPQALTISGLARDNSTILAHEAFRHFGAVALDAATPMWGVVRERIRGGASIGGSEYRAACERRKLARHAFEQAMRPYGALLMPGADQSAQPLDPEDTRHAGLGMFLRPANFLGAPAVALPTSRDRDGMPLGIQLLAPDGADPTLLAVAAHLEVALAAGRPVPDLTRWGLD